MSAETSERRCENCSVALPPGGGIEMGAHLDDDDFMLVCAECFRILTGQEL